MEVLNLEEISPTKRKLTLKIEADDLVPETEEAYEELGKEVEIPGFRKGHVPRKFLEYRFKDEIQEGAFRDTVQKLVDETVKEKELKAIGDFDFSEEEWENAIKKIAEEPVEISVTLEVVPNFDLPAYTDQELEIPPPADLDEIVNRFLREKQEANAYYIAVDDRPVREGDYLVVDTKASRGDEEFPAFTMNKGFLNNLCGGERPEAFDRGFVGRNKGERFEFDFEFDKDYPLYEEGGENKVHVSARILQINERDLPEIDDEFAKDQGFPDLESYRKAIRETLSKNQERVIARYKRDAVLNYLLEHTDILVPATLVQSRYVGMQMIRRQRAAQRGEPESLLSSDQLEELEQNTMFQAESDVKTDLILEEIAKKEGIEISDDEYFEEMAKEARTQGEKNVDRFLADIDRRGMEHIYRQQVLHDKVLSWLVEHNRFKTAGEKSKEE